LILLAVMLFYIYRTNKQNELINRDLAVKNKLIEQQSKEKDMLMLEIHHRVKNNLQIVSSLLNLQANSITDTAAKDALRESHNRVKSIALIHQKLYMQEDISAISLEEYVMQLCNHLKVVFNANQVEISCSVHPPHLKLGMEQSIPLGLILNELITNSIKYAHINKEGGQISIRFVDDLGGNCTLFFSDNGVGMPDNFDVTKATTLGMRMVNELTRQLNGTLVYIKTPSPTFKIVFPMGKI
jgi:two-component sensor histidine kinase